MTSRIAAANVRLKRAYESPSVEDGTRVLVDRLWPRGVAQADAAVDLWLKDLAPSTAPIASGSRWRLDHPCVAR